MCASFILSIVHGVLMFYSYDKIESTGSSIEFSGTVYYSHKQNIYTIEGISGYGESLWLGLDYAQRLPEGLINQVKEFAQSLSDNETSFSANWCCDNQGKVWLMDINFKN